MPRPAPLDVPGVLQQVVVRGIERPTILAVEEDWVAFVDRLKKVLQETETSCTTWALVPNHFSLLLRPRSQPLARCMRRLLIGSAVNFNPRHKRAIHLFQDRCKSIVCDEEAYLLELPRAVHPPEPVSRRSGGTAGRTRSLPPGLGTRS